MPEFICEDCGKRLFQENESTRKREEKRQSKFCRKEGGTHSFMHRDPAHMETFDTERENDTAGNPVLKK